VGQNSTPMTGQISMPIDKCATAHSHILKDPPPEVLFEDFGDSSLVFALYFWIEHSHKTNPLQVASDLRFMINQRFAEENIVLAFPQRDVHFDTAQPLRVELVSPADALPSEKMQGV
jgi:small-conductance mechanosensitive channel